MKTNMHIVSRLFVDLEYHSHILSSNCPISLDNYANLLPWTCANLKSIKVNDSQSSSKRWALPSHFLHGLAFMVEDTRRFEMDTVNRTAEYSCAYFRALLHLHHSMLFNLWSRAIFIILPSNHLASADELM